MREILAMIFDLGSVFELSRDYGASQIEGEHPPAQVDRYPGYTRKNTPDLRQRAVSTRVRPRSGAFSAEPNHPKHAPHFCRDSRGQREKVLGPLGGGGPVGSRRPGWVMTWMACRCRSAGTEKSLSAISHKPHGQCL